MSSITRGWTSWSRKPPSSTPDSLPRWSLEVCRGCVYNCAICGGSAYSYKTYLGMDRPAFRSPAKIVTDIRRLNEQGIRILGLYQDPRMGGAKYTRELLTALRKRNSISSGYHWTFSFRRMRSLFRRSLYRPPGYPSYLSGYRLRFCTAVCWDRHYSNEELLKTVKLCHRYQIPVTSFFSVGLAGETRENYSRNVGTLG